MSRISKHGKETANNKRLSCLEINFKELLLMVKIIVLYIDIHSEDRENRNLHTSNAPVKLQRSWFVFRRGITTDRTGIVGRYLAINLQNQDEL